MIFNDKLALIALNIIQIKCKWILTNKVNFKINLNILNLIMMKLIFKILHKMHDI
jgi:hypothetical protein